MKPGFCQVSNRGNTSFYGVQIYNLHNYTKGVPFLSVIRVSLFGCMFVCLVFLWSSVRLITCVFKHPSLNVNLANLIRPRFQGNIERTMMTNMRAELGQRVNSFEMCIKTQRKNLYSARLHFYFTLLTVYFRFYNGAICDFSNEVTQTVV